MAIVEVGTNLPCAQGVTLTSPTSHATVHPFWQNCHGEHHNHFWSATDIDEAEGVRAVHRAFAAGINYFDTAPFYGATRSEKVLGQALKDLPRSEIVVSSKVGQYGNPHTFDFSAERVTASVHESLQRLQVPYLDIVLCHDVENVDLTQVAKEAIPALAKLRDAGLVKAVGFSGLPLKMFTKLLDLVEPGMVDMVLSWSHCTLADQSLLTLMPHFQAKGLGVISASPLAMGLLTNRGPPSWHPAPESLKKACAAAAEHAKNRGVDISKLALTYALRAGEVSSTLVGMATSDLVDANVRNARQALGLDPNPNAQLEEEVMKEVEEILKPCQGQTWMSGRPENN
ncbi:L-galactose dehydrogenase [Dunaliella salina]|uniref:L-galactose dehydrogenase n=1 Tax=Dunaliella salina TaxID=3046 RepID=A0ABQ7G5N5_DUNSA|nr:L-galactose dehydrogenase [Dunaliella salina]|eukprot:KAF5829923.1 L-galactose dehydrogenase [Dunaliella salina]